MKKWNYIGMIFLMIAGLASCDLMGAIDEVKPQHQLERDNVITDAASAEGLVGNINALWRDGNICNFRLSMSLMSGSVANDRAYNLGGPDFVNNTVGPANSALEALYTPFYLIINSANVAIDLIADRQIPGLTAERRTELLAECHFHRAMAHFYVLRQFGQFYDADSRYGIVLRKTPVNGAEVLPRSGVKESYKLIMEDLEYASRYAARNTEHYHISRLTAMGLKARVLLYMKDYERAMRVADSVIIEAPEFQYGLNREDGESDPYLKIFDEGYNSPEVLWALYAFGSTEFCPSTGFKSTKPSAILEEYAEELGSTSTIGGDIRFAVLFSPEQPEEGGDLPDDELIPDGELIPDDGGIPDGGIPDGGIPDGGGDDGEGDVSYTNLKYAHGNGISGRQGDTYFYLRLAEIYYIYAEAAVRTGKFAEAKARLGEVLERCYYDPEAIKALPDDKAALLQLIRKHKFLELATENYEEWFDMIRYYYEKDLTLSDLTHIKPTITSEKQLILPIPRNAMVGNKLLEQNP